VLVANKVDGLDEASATVEFHALGFDPVAAVSAAHRRGLRAMADAALALAAAHGGDEGDEDAVPSRGVRVAVVGRPNVGKSTLVNRLTGTNRVIAHDAPGTTRDSVEVPFERDGQSFVLVDTAGLRRRARIDDAVEKFSAVKTIKAIEACQVVVLMLDASDGVTEQDAHLLGLVLDAGRAVVIAGNKWDGLTSAKRTEVRSELDRRLRFVDFAPTVMISALHGSGLAELLDAVRRAHAAATADLSTPQLTRVLHAAVERTPPPTVRGRRIKLRYAHQGGSNPPLIVIHGSALEKVPTSYTRYLERVFCDAFKLQGTPMRIEFKSGKNPFADKAPRPLTESEERAAHRARIRGRKKYG
jgi:GTP-binding protein